MSPVFLCALVSACFFVCACACVGGTIISGGRGYEARCALIGCSGLKVPQIQTSLSSSLVRLQQTSGP